jgi:hypothetical protein
MCRSAKNRSCSYKCPVAPLSCSAGREAGRSKKSEDWRSEAAKWARSVPVVKRRQRPELRCECYYTEWSTDGGRFSSH